VAAEISSGALLFRSHCLQCHTLNGVGNPVGPELNYPASVTEYFAATWLVKYIDRPSRVRYGSAMPGLPGDLHERDKAIQHIVAYLAYMAKNKAAPVATEAQPAEQDSEASRVAPVGPAGPATPASVRE
jgi:mono/diheme cytochrome c family protein